MIMCALGGLIGLRTLKGSECKHASNKEGRHIKHVAWFTILAATQLLHSPLATCTNVSSAPGSLFLSGWYLRLSRRYAFLIVASEAERSTSGKIRACECD
jgi:hypothetical protein